MPRIKGPNGLVLTFTDQVAEGLLRSSGYELVKDEAPTKKAADKPSAKK